MTQPVPRILAISDRRLLSAEGGAEAAFCLWLEALRDAGVDAVQVREKDLSDRRVLMLLERAVAVGGPHGPRVLANGRADLASAAGAHGVHLPADGLSVARLRRRYGDRLLLGCSTHDPTEVARARRDGADYVTFGPVFETPSKAAFGRPSGLDGLRRAVDVGLPVLALGGIDAARVEPAAAAGAAGVAAIRALMEPGSLGDLVAACRRVWPVEGGR